MRRPRFIAEQARHAKGPIGRLIAFIMERETWSQNVRGMEALDIAQSDDVLDVGCGPGRSISVLASMAPHGHVVGVDPSKLMTEIAVRRNRRLVKARRVEVVVASTASLPFEDHTFDKALCVHVVYFWNDLDAAFTEIGRVLKPGARFALVFRTSADHQAVKAFPAEVYRFPSLTEVIAPLEAAGFAIEHKDDLCCEPQTTPVLLVATKRQRSGPHEAVV